MDDVLLSARGLEVHFPIRSGSAFRRTAGAVRAVSQGAVDQGIVAPCLEPADAAQDGGCVASLGPRKGTDRLAFLDMAQVKARIVGQIGRRLAYGLGQRTVLRGKAVDGEITGQKRHVLSLVILGSKSGELNYLGLR